MIDGFRAIYRGPAQAAEVEIAASGVDDDNALSSSRTAHEKVPNPRRAWARQRSTAPVMS
jgi:hypothetical protein